MNNNSEPAKVIQSWQDISCCIIAAMSIAREDTQPTGRATIENIGGGIVRVTITIDLVPLAAL